MGYLWIDHNLTYQDCAGHKKGAGSVAMAPVGSSFQFRSPPVTGEIAPKRSAGRRKRQPQERQHSADAETAAGRGTDCSREIG